MFFFTLLRRSFLLGSLLTGFAGLPGCGSHAPVTGEVKGVVLLDGKPLDRVEVLFSPDAPDGGETQVATGLTDAAGNFTLKTQHRSQVAANVIAGRHHVTLRDLAAQPPTVDDPRAEFSETPDPKQARKPRLADKFSDFAKTPLSQVKVGSDLQWVTIEIDSRTQTGTIRTLGDS